MNDFSREKKGAGFIRKYPAVERQRAIS